MHLLFQLFYVIWNEVTGGVMKKLSNLSDICGGNLIGFAAVGCGVGMAGAYIMDPNSNVRDYARSCLSGAIHSTNTSLGIAKSIGSGMYTSYALTGVYAIGSRYLAVKAIPPYTSPGAQPISGCNVVDFISDGY